MAKKYYWLKLKDDFFKRHDTRIIEDMPNGKEYVLFYLKLMAESIPHKGKLRFNEYIPYNEKMLSTITNTNVDIVRSALKVLHEFQLLDVLDDGTLYVAEVQKLIGSESESAERVRNYRKNQKLLQCNTDVTTTLVQCNTDIDKDKNIDKDIEREYKKKKKFTSPTLDEVKAYIKSRGNLIDAQRFYDYYNPDWVDSKGNKVKNWKQRVISWERDAKPKKKENIDSTYDINDISTKAMMNEDYDI